VVGQVHVEVVDEAIELVASARLRAHLIADGVCRSSTSSCSHEQSYRHSRR
jgi:hypothetical protein